MNLAAVCLMALVGASTQAAAAEEASSSMEQMVSNIKQNADNAQHVKRNLNLIQLWSEPLRLDRGLAKN